jgi:hypothetical protein
MTTEFRLRRWCVRSAGAGVVIWLLFVLVNGKSRWDYFTTIERLLLLALLIFTPLALALVYQWCARVVVSRTLQGACYLQPVAALLGVLAFTQPSGVTAALLALPWLLCTGLVALTGLALASAAPRRQAIHKPAHEWVLVMGMLYLPVGASWLLLSRLGIRPLGFPDVIVLLTAIHFHYTGFAVPIITAMIGRFLAQQRIAVPLYPWLAGAVVAATPLIAVGITLAPWLEMVGVLLLFLAVMGLAMVLGVYVIKRLPSPLARSLLTIAAGGMVLAIIPALLYGTGEFFGRTWITIPRMVQLHGFTNAFGFVACGLTGWLVAGWEAETQSHKVLLHREAK